jgi:WS/DGAT/MGAT family acyltransferase
MAYVHCDRLTAVDAAFLAVEDSNSHMHIGSISLFDAEPLTRSEGGLDFDRILEFAAAQLHKTPRFRQKIDHVPAFRQPVWIDDGSFNLLYHLRHTALPAPGDMRRLKRLAGRIMSQQLDRGKPLWELWFIEGIEGNRFAVISKIHHCLADGISGSDAMNLMIGPSADYQPRPHGRWVPRPAPSGGQLLLEEVRHLLELPFRLGGGRRAEAPAPWKAGESSRGGIQALVETVREGLGAPTSTPLNVDIGPHRRIDWTRIDLDAVKEIRARAGGKVNDVVLTVVSGALRRFLKQRGERLEELDFRAAPPVSLRTHSETGTLWTRVSGMLARLPLDEADPWRRLLRIIDTTHELKGSGQAAGGEFIEQLAELVPFRIAAPIARWASHRQGANIVVTNVPGPDKPVYLLGSLMEGSYPVVPLSPTQALGVALFSYNGGLFWGFNSDWDALPDLHDFEEEIQMEFEALRKAAAGAPASMARKGARAAEARSPAPAAG